MVTDRSPAALDSLLQKIARALEAQAVVVFGLGAPGEPLSIAAAFGLSPEAASHPPSHLDAGVEGAQRITVK